VYRYKFHAWKELGSGLANATVICRRLKFPIRLKAEKRNVRYVKSFAKEKARYFTN
jgi:hypothetical protein